MTQYCIALNCHHDSEKNDCKMYSFPSNEELRIVWIKNLGLNGCLPNDHEPSNDSLVCSCHFVGGKPYAELPSMTVVKRKKEGYKRDPIQDNKQIKRSRQDKGSKKSDQQYQKILNCFSDEEPNEYYNKGTNSFINSLTKNASRHPSVTVVKTEEPDYTDIIEVSESNFPDDNGSTMHTVHNVYNNHNFDSDLNELSITLEDRDIKPDIDSLNIKDPSQDNVTILLLEPSKKPSTIKRSKPPKRGRRTKWALKRMDLGIPPVEETEMMIQIEKMVPSPEGQDEIVETDVGKSPEQILSEEHKRLSGRLEKLKAKMKVISAIKSYQKERLTISKLESNPDMLNYYTGIKTLQHFDSIVEDVSKHDRYQSQPHLDILKLKEQILLTFMMLWRNFVKEDLAFRFRISITQTEEIIHNLILILHDLYYCRLPCNDGFLFADVVLEQIYEDAILDSSRQATNCRVIIDCIKTYCNIDMTGDEHGKSRSEEKHAFKGFVAVTPQRSVIFTSSLFPESKSTMDIFESYGILDKILDGKMILSDNCLSQSDKFLKGDRRQSHKLDKRLRSINSKVRLHIGKVTMCQIKKYAILNLIPSFLSCAASQVYQLCSALVNLQSSFTQE